MTNISCFSLLNLSSSTVKHVLQCMEFMDMVAFSQISNKTKFLISQFPTMSNALDPFPLMKLPVAALKNALCLMELPNQIAYSLISNITKAQIISLNLRIRALAQMIGNEILVYIYYYQRMCMEISFYRGQDDKTSSNLGEVEALSASFGEEGDHGGTSVQLMKKGMNYKEWIIHLLEILHHPNFFSTKFLGGCLRFDILSLKRVLDVIGTTALDIGPSCSEAEYLQILRTFEPVKTLRLSRNLPNESRVLCQNYNSLEVIPEMTVTLDHLLMLNTSSFAIRSCRTILSRELNMFLKQWIKGSNGRMTTLAIRYPEDIALDKNVILKGIKYTMGNATRWSMLDAFDTIREQVYINNENGSTAMIDLHTGVYNSFDLTVWHY